MSRRIERVNVQLRSELSELLAQDIKDPRLTILVTITQVEVSVDLRNARVFISVMGNDQEKEAALAGLSSAAGFLHKELKHRLALHHIPQLHFSLDTSIERGSQLLQEINKVSLTQEHPE